MAMAGEKHENPGVEREGYRCPSFCTFGVDRRSVAIRCRLGHDRSKLGSNLFRVNVLEGDPIAIDGKP
jgi:hypothetical protein